jgi:thiamine-phosphate pyrophosphorylase
MTPAEAREIVGSEAIVGLSTHSREQIEAAAEQPVDYISVGPIWETPTKQGRPATGLELIQTAAEIAKRPWFAIGGIDTENVADVIDAGASRICVVRAIRDAADPRAAATALFAGVAPTAREEGSGGR